MRRRGLICLCMAVLLGTCVPAQAYWRGAGSGAGSAPAATLPTTGQPSASAAGQTVTVTWPQTTFQGNPLGSLSGGGYTIKRYAQGGSTALTPGAGCATAIAGSGATLQCVETGVPVGDWQYVATAALNTFTGSGSIKSAVVNVVGPPANTALPTISGVTNQGQTLTASNGTWTNSPTGYDYQWRRCDTVGANCVDIAGATASSYVLTSGEVNKTVRVVVTAANGSGSASATSAATSLVTVPPAPINTVAPTISGTAVAGATLTASNGTWTNNPTGYAYQWQYCNSDGVTCTNLSGETGATYVPSTFLIGYRIRVVVTATNAGGSANGTATATAAIVQAPPANAGLPQISGTASQGRTLTTTTGTWANSPTGYAYQWRRCDGAGANCTDISGATATTYLLVAADVGKTIRAVVAATNPTGSTSATSAATSAVVVTPQLSFSSSTVVTSLPSARAGSLAFFASGETLTYRLDNQTSGTLLTASTTPSTIGAAGTATISVTIPTGTASGPHTVFAIGSQGSVASADISVELPVARSYTTTAWEVSDQSSGTAKDTSDPFAAPGGVATLPGFPTDFDSAGYVELDYNGPLRPGFAVSGVNFNYSLLATSNTYAASDTCFYVEVLRISSGSVIGTHGSPSSPVACSTGGAIITASTALPEVTTTTIANDLRIRVYQTNSAGTTGYVFTDVATVSGTASGSAFTLQREKVTLPTYSYMTFPYSLLTADGSDYTSDSGWGTSFSTSKYLALTFPDYAPATATGVSATFTHTYRSDTTSSPPTTCWYFAVYNGATLLATHGSSSSPVSCATSSYVTNTVSLPEVNTVTKANNIVIRLYVKNSQSTASKAKSDHDAAYVTVSYSG